VKDIFIDLERCQGCKSCELACAIEHSLTKNIFSAISETPPPRKRVFVEYAEGKRFPIQCRHCEEAPCVAICVSGALSQDEAKGLITHNRDRCLGCGMCVIVCPFGVIAREMESKIIIKCDRCPDRDEPACVEACPVSALTFTDLEEIEKSKRRGVIKNILVGGLRAS